ncbi:energy-coupled thiamine transporter ThiT [Bacillus solimangrovi]|uniref:Energy-coupled thiamine transporter ThiT n=1 Tax=Bacillus solimangrovi TaxID=1305675 RepID=A0A1E5LJU7_9BACI|nr:energy-coupled thiamine transporter ThiT [Bacillus solimangrovi]OEH94367.1 energy-coupled thiamine transporter ThiT [Bacillus solimangrovi]
MLKNKPLIFLLEIAILSAAAFVLELFSFQPWPQGGSVSLSMIPVFLVAFRWGLSGGLFAGLILGLLNMMFGGYIATPVQAFLDYIAAFSLLGIAGLFAKPAMKQLKQNNKELAALYVTAGVLLASFLRFLCHFTAGVVFFGEYAPEGTPVWLYSLLYNGSFMLPIFVIGAIVMNVLVLNSSRLFQRTSSNQAQM